MGEGHARFCSPSAPCRARCCRSSSVCCGRASWQLAGPIIGMPFSLEGFAFFTEAIFLGVYLYGWDRISPRAHLAAGVIVAAERRGVGGVRRDGQRVDEHARRVHDVGRSDRAHRSDRRHVQPVDVPAGAAHAAGGVRGDRLRLSPAFTRRSCCASRRRVSSSRAHARAAHRRARGDAPTAVRRLQRAHRRAMAADQARRARGTVRDGARRAAAHRRLAG